MNKTIWSKLMRLGLPPHMRGTTYLADAIELWTPDAFISKEIYPAVAKKRGATWTAVERAIRYTIRYTWEHQRGLTSDIVELFGVWALHIPPKPGEFIAALAVWEETH